MAREGRAAAAAAASVVVPVQVEEDDEEPEPDWIEDGEVEELDAQLGPAVVEAMRAASVPAWYKRRFLWCVKASRSGSRACCAARTRRAA
jgi:hypothetical protein